MSLFTDTDFDGPTLEGAWSASTPQGYGGFSLEGGWLYTPWGSVTPKEWRLQCALKNGRQLRVQQTRPYRFPNIPDCDPPYWSHAGARFPAALIPVAGIDDSVFMPVRFAGEGGQVYALMYWALAGDFDIYTRIQGVWRWGWGLNRTAVRFGVGWHPGQVQLENRTFRLSRDAFYTDLYLRIARVGRRLYGYSSADGVTWTPEPYWGTDDTGSPPYPITFVELYRRMTGGALTQIRSSFIKAYTGP